MDDVKRYKKNGEILGRALVAAKDGEYVKYHDYAALRARLDAVEKEQIMLRAERDGLASLLLSVQQESIAATQALATARRDALEEAAGLTPYDCDGHPAGQFDNHVFVKRDAIRALIAQEESKL